MKIDLPLWDKDNRKWRVVEGAELVDVAPHLSGTFAVHRCPWYPEERSDMVWVVTNIETGAKVPVSWYDSTRKKDVIAAARSILFRKTEAEYQKRLREIELEIKGHE